MVAINTYCPHLSSGSIPRLTHLLWGEMGVNIVYFEAVVCEILKVKICEKLCRICCWLGYVDGNRFRFANMVLANIMLTSRRSSPEHKYILQK